MPTDELMKALDELGTAARRAEKKADKANAKKKAERKAAKAAEAAKADEPANADLAKALARAEEAEKVAREARETVEKMASEDGQKVLVNGTGLAAILRDPEQGPDAIKQFDADFARAQEAYEKNPTAATKAALTQAGQRRTSARLIAGENVRQNSLEAIARTQRGVGNPLFTNTTTHGLIEDSAVTYR